VTPNVHFWKNQIIFEEGYIADAAFLICEGSVEVFKVRANQHITLAMLEQDAIFGEMGIISDKLRSATVRAVSDVWCYAISKRTFLEKLKNIPPDVRNVFDQLVDAIRHKSEAAVLIDHGRVRSLEGSMEDLAASNLDIRDKRLLQDPVFLKGAEDMDAFMRAMFKNLLHMAR
jgi:CRP-like cAMP-binding protein